MQLKLRSFWRFSSDPVYVLLVSSGFRIQDLSFRIQDSNKIISYRIRLRFQGKSIPAERFRYWPSPIMAKVKLSIAGFFLNNCVKASSGFKIWRVLGHLSYHLETSMCMCKNRFPWNDSGIDPLQSWPKS